MGVCERKQRIQITLLKTTVQTIDELIKQLEKANPLVPYTRSSVLEGAFLAQIDAIIKEYETKNQNNKEEK